VSGLSAVARRAAMRLVPARRRDWVKAVWAEAAEVPPGLRRLAWHAGGVRLVARETLMRRGTGSAMLFAVASALAVWVAWPGPMDSFAASVDRADLIAVVVLLAGLALVARRFFGPAGGGRAARFLRAGTYAAILALIPAKNVIEQVLGTPPRGGTDLRLYLLISGPGFGSHWDSEILFLVVMALYAAAILWLTSRRSRVAPATLAIGIAGGAAVGAVWYAAGPLGFGGEPATNPWLPDSGSAPVMVLAWILLFGAPVAAAIAADRCCTAPGRSVPPAGARAGARAGASASAGARARARAGQIVAAGLITSLVGALSVTVGGTSTIAAMLKSAWLRNWIYHGHQLSGVAGLRHLISGNPGALTYSHEITAAVDAPPFLIICIVFPLTALLLTGLGALVMWANATPGEGNPPRGDGSPPPEPVSDPPPGAQLAGPGSVMAPACSAS
jgi:hypothetical protein